MPLADFDRISAGRPILVLAPHPDDETLGCGGLIAAAGRLGVRVDVMILTDGAGSHPNSQAYRPERLGRLRECEARAAAAVLGLAPERLGFIGFRDSEAPHEGGAFDAAVERLAATIAAAGSGLIVATWRHDPHRDHVAAHRLAAAAARRTGARHLAYPVWGWALPAEQELPDTAARGVRLDISAELAAKRLAVACHQSQIGCVVTDDPEPRLALTLLKNFDQPFEVFLEP